MRTLLCPFFVPTGITDSDRNRPGRAADDATPTKSQLIGQAMSDKAVEQRQGHARRRWRSSCSTRCAQNHFYIYSHPKALDERADAAGGRDAGAQPDRPVRGQARDRRPAARRAARLGLSRAERRVSACSGSRAAGVGDDEDDAARAPERRATTESKRRRRASRQPTRAAGWYRRGPRRRGAASRRRSRRRARGSGGRLRAPPSSRPGAPVRRLAASTARRRRRPRAAAQVDDVARRLRQRTRPAAPVAAVDDHLRRVDEARAGAARQRVLPLGGPGLAKRSTPAEAVPVVDVEGQRDARRHGLRASTASGRPAGTSCSPRTCRARRSSARWRRRGPAEPWPCRRVAPWRRSGKQGDGNSSFMRTLVPQRRQRGLAYIGLVSSAQGPAPAGARRP